MRKSLTVLFLIFVSALGFSWIFLGCSGAAGKYSTLFDSFSSTIPEDAGGGGGLTAEEQAAIDANKAKAAEEEEGFNYFPYDLQLDTIAYLGCDTQDFFSFKAGAYFNRSGLRMSEFFLQKQDDLSNTEMEELIKTSTKLQAFPALSFAIRANLLQNYGPSEAIQAPLALSVADIVESGDERIRSFGRTKTMEGEFRLGATSKGYMKLLDGRGKYPVDLLLSYKDSKKSVYHQTGGTPGVDLYGRLYQIGTAEIKSEEGLSQYTLASVEEEKIPENNYQTSWECPETLVFEVRRHAKNKYTAQKYYDSRSSSFKTKYSIDQAMAVPKDDNDHIPPDELGCPDSTETGAVADVTRKVLGKHWNINPKQKCISPKSSSDFCYGLAQVDKKHLRRLVDPDDECSNKAREYCPRYLSICIRKN